MSNLYDESFYDEEGLSDPNIVLRPLLYEVSDSAGVLAVSATLQLDTASQELQLLTDNVSGIGIVATAPSVELSVLNNSILAEPIEAVVHPTYLFSLNEKTMINNGVFETNFSTRFTAIISALKKTVPEIMLSKRGDLIDPYAQLKYFNAYLKLPLPTVSGRVSKDVIAPLETVIDELNSRLIEENDPVWQVMTAASRFSLSVEDFEKLKTSIYGTFHTSRIQQLYYDKLKKYSRPKKSEITANN